MNIGLKSKIKIMRVAVIIVRVLMGLLFLVSVVGYFFHLMPQPELGENAKLFVGGLMATGYLMPVVKIVELFVAIALLTGRFMPLALVVIFPITINIVLFHGVL